MIRAVIFDQKAFDKLWHDGLIFILKQNDVSGNPSNRKQRVVLND